MSANFYTVEELLVGKLYRSKTLQGEIVSAEKNPAHVHYGEAESYLVRVYDSGKYHYRTVAVGVGA